MDGLGDGGYSLGDIDDGYGLGDDEDDDMVMDMHMF